MAGTERNFRKVVLLILESLGSTELLFILAMALVFFGPRKLPQLSRSLGKSMAEFRRASEDFKRTWDREVSLEEVGTTAVNNPPAGAFEEFDLGTSDRWPTFAASNDRRRGAGPSSRSPNNPNRSEFICCRLR